MTEELKQLREALRRVKYEAVSLADAQVIALEALTAAQPAQAGEGDETAAFEAWVAKGGRSHQLRLDDHGMYEDLTVVAWWAAWQARASLSTQPAAQTDSMGMPTSCGKPLCLPDEHHPLCKLHKPAAQDTPEPTVTYATVRAAYDELHIECRFSDGQKFAAVTVAQGFDNLAHRIETMLNESQQATPEPVGEPFAWTSMGQIRFTPPTQDHDTYTPLYTHPAPGVPDGVQHEIAAALALFPINITGQSFVVSGFNDGKLLEADGDTFFFSQQKVIALLEKLHTHLAAAQAKGGGHD